MYYVFKKLSCTTYRTLCCGKLFHVKSKFNRVLRDQLILNIIKYYNFGTLLLKLTFQEITETIV